MLLRRYVLSNTYLDDKTKQIQVTRGIQKYQNAEYDDNTVEYLMKYLGLESYEQLQTFLNIVMFRYSTRLVWYDMMSNFDYEKEYSKENYME